MAEEFNDLSFGDETRRNGDYVSLPVDETESADAREGDAVGLDGDGNLVQANSESGEEVEPIGVLYTYQYFEEANAGEQIDYDRDATVKVGGTVKAWVDDDVSAGDTLVAGDDSDGGEEAGQFVTGTDDGSVGNFVAISDAASQTGGPRNESQHIDDRDGDHFAEVLLR